jgi:DNA-binding response OmpR family regulator
MKVLLVEDEKRMALVLQKALEEEGYSVQVAGDGIAGQSAAETGDFDLILLDVMLPRLNGFDLARRLRAEGSRCPILMLTARDATSDIVTGLDAGADDYLPKPFSLAVLFARMRALERRAAEVPRLVLRAGDLVVDVAERRVFRGPREVFLTPREFRLLEVLLKNQGRVASRRAIIDFVWGASAASVGENTLDAFIRLLRRKIDENEAVKLIYTIRGVGYRLGRAAEC